MHSVLILSGLLTLASAATIHMPARALSGKDLFRRESEPTCWKEKYTMSVEVAEKILCTLKEKAEKGEQCCAKEKGQEVVCASDPAEEKKEGEGEKKEGGGEKMRRTEEKEGEEKETVSGLYLVTKGEGKQDQCVKAEALVEVVEKIIESCKSEGEGESEDEKKKEEEEKEKEEKEKEEKDKQGGGSGGEKMRRTEEPKEGEKEGEEKKVGGWQAVEQCEGLYVSLHAGEAWCPEDTEKNICVKEEKEH